MWKILKGVLLLTIIGYSPKMQAKDFTVINAAEFVGLKLAPGDKVILSGNAWKDQEIVFKAKGTEEQPIILTSAKPGEIICSGNSNLKIDGEWLVVDGLAFSNGYPEKEDVIAFSKTSRHCRLTNSSILNYNPPYKTKDYKWVSVYGTNNRVDHCALTGKTNQGTTLVIWLSETPNYDRIDHNYFGPRPDLGSNGGESIRIGTSEWSMHDSYAKVEFNVFDKCNGETEIISIKSGHNIIINNLFYECEGTLTFRHGNNSEAAYNFFIGNNVKNTGGIRVIGENQRVHDNYLEGLTGSGFRAAISVMNAFENPKPNEYFQVNNAIIKNNIIIDCKEAIAIGSGKDDKRILPPVNLVMIENVIINPIKLINYFDVPLESTIKNNQIKGVAKEDGFTVFKGSLIRNKFNLWEINYQVVSPFWLVESVGPNNRNLNFSEMIKF
ncbi:Alginate lyase precursor [Arcticibacter svalbardensis MN12-7]|uniref:Alginate lyase n=2 Tax=Arcticibacter TaxID=1288026 RepID=R9GT68_9SPHI|nr:Alginate lyase precursor [Arcticibacter svalbardensis MN12-7]